MPLILRIRDVALPFALLELFAPLVPFLLLKTVHFLVGDHIGQIITELVLISAFDGIIEAFFVVSEDVHRFNLDLAICAQNVLPAHMI